MEHSSDIRRGAWMLVAIVLAAAGTCPAQPADAPAPAGRRTIGERPVRPRGLVLNTPAAQAGYNLFAPLRSKSTYLVDLAGKQVHAWRSEFVPGQAVYLLDDGTLLRCARQPNNKHFGGGGIGGRVQRLAPDGKVLWDFVLADEKRCLHHDIEPLPNGNVLMIAWEKRTRAEAVAAGRDPDEMKGDELWPDVVIEVKPDGATGGKIVWAWRVWDHLVQEFDRKKPHFGIIERHPGRVDINYRDESPPETPAETDRLRALGYVAGAEPKDDEKPDADGPPPGGPGRGGFGRHADWCHTNAIDYNAELDQIVLSVPRFNEVWIIDHGTTTAEAAGSTGGRCGRGGDLLYRWGNPRAYGLGGAADQKLFAQHDVRWVRKGSPGAGHLTIFNNGDDRPGGSYSSVVEIAPPINANGTYDLTKGEPFGPAEPRWEYTAPKKDDFFAGHISGAERLANGNTLICNGEQGRIFEVTAAGETVWDYLNPYIEEEAPDDGPGPRVDRPGPPRDENGMHGGPPPPAARTEGGPASDRHSRRGPGGRRGPREPGALFRASRVSADHPGLRVVLGSADRPG